MSSIRLTDNMSVILGHHPHFAHLPACNSLRIEDEAAVIIDTGASDVAKYQGKTEIVINTHFHKDHTILNHLFAEQAQLWVPSYSAEVFENPEKVPEYIGFHFLDPASQAELMTGEKFISGMRVHHTIQDGDVLDFGKTKLHVIHAPGHACDHIMLYEEKNGILFSTDVDMTPFGPWYGNPHSSMTRFVEDIEKVRAIQPAVLITSHMPEIYTENLDKLLDTYASKIDKRDERILNILREKPCTLEEVMEGRPIFRKHAPPVALNRLFDRLMTKHHMDRLVERGLIREEEGLYMLAEKTVHRSSHI